MTNNKIDHSDSVRRLLTRPSFILLAIFATLLPIAQSVEVYLKYLAEGANGSLSLLLSGDAPTMLKATLGFMIPVALIPSLLIAVGAITATVGASGNRPSHKPFILGLNISKVGMLLNVITSYLLLPLGLIALIAFFINSGDGEMRSTQAMVYVTSCLVSSGCMAFRAKYFTKLLRVVNSFTLTARTGMPMATGSRLVTVTNLAIIPLSIIGSLSSGALPIVISVINGILLALIDLCLWDYDRLWGFPTDFVRENSLHVLATSNEKRDTALGIGLQLDPENPYGALRYGKRGAFKRTFGLSVYAEDDLTAPDAPQLSLGKRDTAQKQDDMILVDKMAEDPDALYGDGLGSSAWRARFATGLTRLRSAIELLPKVTEERNILTKHRRHLEELRSRLISPDEYQFRESSDRVLAELAESAAYRESERLRRKRAKLRTACLVFFALSWALIPFHAVGFIFMGATVLAFGAVEMSFLPLMRRATVQKYPKDELKKDPTYLSALEQDIRMEGKKKEEYASSYNRITANVSDRISTVDSDLQEIEENYREMTVTAEKYPYLYPIDRNVPFINKLIYTLDWEKVDSVNGAIAFTKSRAFYDKYPAYDNRARKYQPAEYKDVSEVARICGAIESELANSVSKLCNR